MKIRNISVATLALIVGVACSSGSNKKRGSAGESAPSGTGDLNGKVEDGTDVKVDTTTQTQSDAVTGVTDPTVPVVDPVVPEVKKDPMQAPVGVGIRNFDQINYSLSAITGVAPTSAIGVTGQPATVALVYAAEKSSLPTGNDVKAISPAQVSSATKVAAAYCSGLINVPANATQRTAIFGTFNFAGLPSAVFTDNSALISSLTALWGSNLASNGDMANYKAILDQLIKDLVAGKPDTAATTTAAVTGACAATLGSAPVLLY